MYRAVPIAALIVTAAQAQPQDDLWKAPPPAWEGTWQGTIGSLPVHVCLNNTPYENRGAYYYDRHKALISLELDERGDWVEGEARENRGPHWKLGTTAANELAGAWSDGKRNLPIRLRRIGGPSQEYEGPCSTIEFHGSRISPVTPTRKHAVKDGVSITEWLYSPGPPFEDVEISTFTLDGSGAAIAKVNTILSEPLPKDKGVVDWLACIAGNANAHGADGLFYRRIEPQLITRRWLAAIEHGEYYCGGAHPSNESIPHTFDLARGIEVDPLDWFTPNAVKREDLGGENGVYKTLSPEFVAVILAGWKDDERSECDEATRTQESWSAGIARGALVFSPDFPRVIMACGDDYKVPFARLQSWLNTEGRAAVATLPR